MSRPVAFLRSTAVSRKRTTRTILCNGWRSSLSDTLDVDITPGRRGEQARTRKACWARPLATGGQGESQASERGTGTIAKCPCPRLRKAHARRWRMAHVVKQWIHPGQSPEDKGRSRGPLTRVIQRAVAPLQGNVLRRCPARPQPRFPSPRTRLGASARLGVLIRFWPNPGLGENGFALSCKGWSLGARACP